MHQTNHLARSLVEQLSGIRLIAFFGLAAINLAVLSALCIIPLNLEQPALTDLLFLSTAIVSLAALTVSSLSASATTKISVIMLVLTASLWMVRWVSLPSDLQRSSIYASVFIFQAVLIFVATTVHQERDPTIPTSLRFGIKEIFFAIATVAILIPVLQYIFSEWPPKLLFQADSWSKIGVLSLTNSLWTFAVLFWYLKQESRSRKRATAGALTIAAIVFDVVGYFLGSTFADAIDAISLRVAFVVWIAVSMLPVIGFKRSGND